MNESNTTIIQEHLGSGDNVNNKFVNVYKELTPEAIHNQIEMVLTSHRERNQSRATAQYEVLRATEGLNKQSLNVVEIIGIHIGVSDVAPSTEIYKKLVSSYRDTDNPLFKDICLTALNKLDAEQGRAEEARARYFSQEKHGRFSKESFFELLANKNELLNEIQNQCDDLLDGELNGLIRGLIRIGEFDNAVSAANKLDELYPSFNSKVLKFIASANKSNQNFRNKHYWTLTATERKKFISMVDEAISLINECDGQDLRLFNVAVPSLAYCMGSHEELRNICWKYINQTDRILPEVGGNLRNIYTQNIEFLVGIHRQMANADNDDAYKLDLIQNLSNKKTLEEHDAVLLGKYAQPFEVKKWLEKGGSINTNEDFARDFTTLHLKVIAHDERDSIESLENDFNTFLIKHEHALATLNPARVHDLALDLKRKKEAIFCRYRFTPTITITGELVVLSVVSLYLSLLLESEQFATLEETLKKIDTADRDIESWDIQARLFEYKGDFVQAIDASKQAVDLAPDSSYLWAIHISYITRYSEGEYSIPETLKQIPDIAFHSKSPHAVSLLMLMDKYGLAERAEKLLLSWFLDNPNETAKYLTSYHFGNIIDQTTTTAYSAQLEEFKDGVSYSVDGRNRTQILFDGTAYSNPFVLDINSPLGQLIKGMAPGESKRFQTQEIILHERVAPFAAAINICAEIRLNQNDGTDAFYSFNMPSDPKEMMEAIKEKLSNPDKEEQNKKILEKPNIPIMMKGHILNKDAPTRAAIELLSNRQCIKNPLPAEGAIYIESIIIDVYAAVYLSLTGLLYCFIENNYRICITETTQYHIKKWIEEVTRDDYLTIGLNEKHEIVKITSEDIDIIYGKAIGALNKILEISEKVPHGVIDVPEPLARIQEYVDSSTYETIKASLSNGIPVYCIDSSICILLKDAGINFVNTLQETIRVSGSVDLETKKNGIYRYANDVIPYPMTYQEIAHLSYEDDDLSTHCLAKILKKDGLTNLPDFDHAVLFAIQILKPVLARAYLNKNILDGLSASNPCTPYYTEAVFNACCDALVKYKTDATAEIRVATLFDRLFSVFQGHSKMISLIAALASSYSAGHFMDIDTINSYLSK